MNEPRAESHDARRRAEALLGQHQGMVRSYLRHLLQAPADADDLAQELWVMVLAQPEILLRGADPAAYLRGIARHLASRHRLAARRAPAFEELIEARWLESRSPAQIERELEALGRCLEKVPARMRQVLDWRYREGQSATSIAERLATTGEAVRMALMRARQALGRCLAEQLAAEAPALGGAGGGEGIGGGKDTNGEDGRG